MRICILGDSHTVALKSGWDRIRVSYPGVTITIFAARGPTMGRLEADGTDLVPGTMSLREQMEYTSGRSQVRTGDFDVFVLSGMFLLPLWTKAGLSRAVITAANAEQYRLSISGTVAKVLRSVTQAPIYIMPKPLVAQRPDPPVAEAVPPYPEQIALLTRYFETERFHFVCQPAETMPEGWFTRPDFSIGSGRLVVAPGLEGEFHPERETNHMNADYGELALGRFLATVT